MTRLSKKHLIVAANFAVLAITVSISMNSRKAVAEGQGTGGPRGTIDGPLPLPVTQVAQGVPFQKTVSSSGFTVSFGSPAAGTRWIVEHVSGDVASQNPLTVEDCALTDTIATGGDTDFLIVQRESA